MAEYLKLSQARHVDLSFNNIEPMGGAKLITQLSQSILTLNLSDNLLGKGKKFVDALCYHFEAQMQCLMELNLN